MSELSEFPATLDLSSADTRGNEMENGWKDAVVFEVKPIVTDNPDGKLPPGTPGINVQFQIEGGKFNNRRVFNRYWMPPVGYDEEKRQKSLGMLARFLEAAGFTDVKSASFSIADAIAKMNTENPPCQVNTRYDSEYDNNRVTGVKARSGSNASTGAGVL